VREPPDDVDGQLSPQRIVPAELSTAEHVHSIERVEVEADVMNAGDASRHVARYVIGNRRTDP
jgi:hypothetical protein